MTIECGGMCGSGAALIDPGGEEPIYAAFDGVRAALDDDPLHLARNLDAASGASDDVRALAAVDIALHDLFGKALGCPLHRALGLAGVPLGPTAISIGCSSVDQVLERAEVYRGWPILKVKQSADLGLDWIPQVRSFYSGRLWIDGNGVFSRDEAIDACRLMSAHGVELLEQPIPAGDIGGLDMVRRAGRVRVVADEDCTAPADVLALRGHVDVVNLKLTKLGGLRPVLRAIHLARTVGLGIMLGCKTESSLGVTAMAQLGGFGDFLDLDGNVDIVDDPFLGLEHRGGAIYLPSGPGIGVTASGIS